MMPVARALRSLLPSLLLLGAVFFFINTACLNGGSDDEACVAQPISRPGDAVAIVAPADGTVISGQTEGGPSQVQVELSATGVTPAPKSVCDGRAGTFTLTATLDPSCPSGAPPGFVHLSQGETQTQVSLAPGIYELRADFTSGSGSSFNPPLTASVRITVARDSADGGAPCP